jgi:DNA-binding CsgD family transcriptional regulator
MALLKGIFIKIQHIGLYGLLLAALVFGLKWLQWKFLVVDISLEVYIGVIAAFFTILGIWMARLMIKPKVETIVIEKVIPVHRSDDHTINHTELKKLGLTSREYEILELLTKGCSNAEIAGSLFLSLSTVKTHVSNLFVKMDVKSRTQAIEKAKRLKIVA